MIPHRYINASDDPGAYNADLCDRQAVTAEFAYAKLCDEPVYTFDAEAHAMGLDGWRLLGGMDRLTSGNTYVIEWGSTGEKRVPADFRLYAQRSTLRKLGIEPGKPGGPAGHETRVMSLYGDYPRSAPASRTPSPPDSDGETVTYKAGDKVDLIDRRDGTVVARNATILSLTTETLPGLGEREVAYLDIGYGVTTRCLRPAT